MPQAETANVLNVTNAEKGKELAPSKTPSKLMSPQTMDPC